MLHAKPPFNMDNNLPNLQPVPDSLLPNGTTFIVMAYTRSVPEPIRRALTIVSPIAHGTFGRVYKAVLDNSLQPVATKQVAYDSPYQEREPTILNYMEEHCNVVRLIMHCYVQLGVPRLSYMLMVMEYMPMTLLTYLSTNSNCRVPLIYVRVLSYQIFRGLAHLHSHNICHRDVKPDNILIDTATMTIKLSDFGSAKHLKEDEPNATYICSHIYRAPELFAKIELYGTAVDIWSAGCVLAEMMLTRPLFQRDNNPLLHIVGVLGTDGLQHCPQITDKINFPGNLPLIPRPSWHTLIGDWVPQDLAELLNQCLVFQPVNRITAMRAIGHASYDELRIMDALEIRMPNGAQLPQLFNFSQRELDVDLDMWVHIMPLKFPENT